jgi:hypothetical protein
MLKLMVLGWGSTIGYGVRLLEVVSMTVAAMHRLNQAGA